MNVVVTGGGTIAPIDDVRHIANVSTGRFSAEIAEACLRRGADVWHVHAPTALLPFSRSAAVDLDAEDFDEEVRRVAGVREEYRRVRGRLRLRPIGAGGVRSYENALRNVFETVRVDMAFLAMAASDFEPEAVAGKVDSDREEWLVRLKPTPKVIRSVRDWAPSSFLVGFKLLSGSTPPELIAKAEAAGETNRADLTVANDLRTLREGRHAIYLVRPGERVEALGPGGAIAEGLVRRAFAWAEEKFARA